MKINVAKPQGIARWGRPLLGASALALALSFVAAPATASSHREAPFITQLPKVDGTDFYMFRSTETGRTGFVTIIANYAPLQDSYGGPNYFQMDPNALYSIHIDTNGDAKPDWTFQFAFQNTLADNKINVGGKMVSIPLVNNGLRAVDSPFDPGLNVRETFNVAAFRAPNTWKMVTNAANNGAFFDKPVDNIGNKTIPNYPAYAAKHVYNVNIPDCATQGRVFVGQRKDPFVVNLGETFDLINIALPATEFSATAEKAARDDLAYKNVTTIAMEIPISCLTNGTDPVIGAWTTASIRETRTMTAAGAGMNANATYTGGYTQVSRLGMPLVNEVVIGLKDKDKFNGSQPADDGQFADYVTNPVLPVLVQALFGAAGVKAPTNYPRMDLVTAFLTGVPGLNKPAGAGVASEMLRLNTAVPAVAKGSQNRLGVIAGDTAGYPNGRRLGDDVVDISLRVIMGKLCTLSLGCVPADAPSGGLGFTDGAYVDDSFFDDAFPYVKNPLPGSPQVGAKSAANR